MVNAVNDTGPDLETLGLSRPKQTNRNNEELGAQQFMDLMLAQMRNQDPLQPMENGQFLAQIAQFSTVSGIKELQTSVSSLATSMQSSQALQASSLVGRTVLAPGEEGYLAEGGVIYGEVSLPASTQNLTLSIFDESGQLVREVGLGQQPSGDVTFEWDGGTADGQLLPPGNYTFKAEALMDGKNEALDMSLYANVESVDLGRAGQGIQLNLAGMGSVKLTDVKRVI